MKLWKVGALLTFGLITGICVSYAHSSPVQEQLEWKSSFWLGGCGIKVEKLENGLVNFKPTSETRTVFAGIWPTEAGEVYMEAPRPADRQDQSLIGVENAEPDETLRVRFSMVVGQLQPVSYTYEHVKARINSGGRVQPKVCAGLAKVN